MLYLNLVGIFLCYCLIYLTLTSVVFEFRKAFEAGRLVLNLTLTSVVFELERCVYVCQIKIIFNFNKCCI